MEFHSLGRAVYSFRCAVLCTGFFVPLFPLLAYPTIKEDKGRSFSFTELTLEEMHPTPRTPDSDPTITAYAQHAAAMLSTDPAAAKQVLEKGIRLLEWRKK